MVSNTPGAGTRMMAFPEGARLDPRAAAQALLAAGPSHLLPPAETPYADGLIAAGKIGAARNAAQTMPLGLAPWNSPAPYTNYAAGGGMFEAVGFGSPTVQHGPFTLAKDMGTETPVGPGLQPKRSPQVQPERIPQTVDGRGAGEGDTQVARSWFEKFTGSERTPMTGNEAINWEAAQRRWKNSSSRVWAEDPDWRPEPGLWDNTAKGKINSLNDAADQAEKRLRELQRVALPADRLPPADWLLPEWARRPTREAMPGDELLPEWAREMLRRDRPWHHDSLEPPR